MATKLKIKPLGDRVLVVQADAGEKEQIRGGIIIPHDARELPQWAVVVAVGPGMRGPDGKRVPLTIKKGDKVVLAQHAGTDVRLNDTHYKLVREVDLIAHVS